MPVRADDFNVHVILNNAQYHTHADCMKEKISDHQRSDCRRARGHFTCKQQDYEYVLMFVVVYFVSRICTPLRHQCER